MGQEVSRRLRAHALRSVLAAAGIAVATVGMITPANLVSSVGRQMTAGLRGLGSATIFILPETSSATSRGLPQLTLADATALRQRATSLEAVSPFISVQGMVRACGRKTVTFITGTTPERQVLDQSELAFGRFILTSDLARHQQVAVVGAAVRNEFPCISEGSTIELSGRPFRIVGGLNERGSRFGLDLDDVVLIPLPFAEERYAVASSGNIAMLAKVAEGHRADEAIAEISQILRRRDRAGEQRRFSVRAQTELIAAAQRAQDSAIKSVVGVVAFGLLVAAIGVLNALTTAVVERTSEIGLRRSVGATRTNIRNHFLAEALVISVSGSMLGLVFSVSLTWAVTAAFELPFVIDRYVCVVAVCGGVVLGTTAGVWPAMRAATLNPVQALHHD